FALLVPWIWWSRGKKVGGSRGRGVRIRLARSSYKWFGTKAGACFSTYPQRIIENSGRPCGSPFQLPTAAW
ncbi:hypothetical protein LLF88_07615, partial [bacterium]|nr:hypothetical protein [bacterium]